MRAKFIYEKFTEESDPIKDLGIGMEYQIKEWMKSKGYEYEDKDNALIKCAIHGKTEFVRYLLDAGADVHADNDYALIYASENGYTEVVKLLLDAGADVHVENDYALRYASYNGRTEVVKLLLDAGADVHANNDDALRWASRYGHTEVVKLLLDAGADVHADDDAALRWASRYGHTEVVKLLLDAGSDVHANEDASLRNASYRRHTKTVKLLKDHIAKENNSKNIKETLNEKFIEDSDPIEDLGIGVHSQLKKWVEKNGYLYGKHFCWSRDLFGYGGMLAYAASENKFEFVKYLVDSKKAEANYLKSLALRWAAAHGNVEMIKYLIENGANPDDDDGGDSLECARAYNRKKAVEYLTNLKNKK